MLFYFFLVYSFLRTTNFLDPSFSSLATRLTALRNFELSALLLRRFLKWPMSSVESILPLVLRKASISSSVGTPIGAISALVGSTLAFFACFGAPPSAPAPPLPPPPPEPSFWGEVDGDRLRLRLLDDAWLAPPPLEASPPEGPATTGMSSEDLALGLRSLARSIP
eukprot:CAMPEP_0197496708 /NCGR_PEP_ID=MMETSP1311-20131121/46459_1 /TAXON_ID=464262 /ORGANISM="Genus nov. species nov., Strain RCC856" /LENGTH=165 /DNA_ID=CAMNT_0043042311 /DNA_START=89 /DNA_END=583 /DNA_ORIENTATION=+